MKKIVKVGIAFLILATCLQARAATSDNITKFIVHLVNGEQYSFSLPDSPVVTFNGSDMSVQSSVADITLSRSEVLNMDFYKSTSSIAELTDDSDFSFSFFDNSTVSITGKRIYEAAVYSISGVEALRREAVDGSVILDVESLAAGVYVIAVPGYRSIKIIKK